MTFNDILPSLLALLATVLTLFVNYKLGQVKDTSELKIARISEEKEFREDLIQMVRDYDTKIEKQDLKITDLQRALNNVREENYELKVTKSELERKLVRLQDDLDQFDKKVYYRNDPKRTPDTDKTSN